MRTCLILVLWFCTASLFSQSTVESVPNQKLINGSYVSNPDAILDASTVLQLDTLLRSLEEQTSVQVAVVALNSIGEVTIEDFAQQLFSQWGVGNKEKDNGLLVLLVNDLRTIRFHTGYGLEGVLPDITCKRIQREYMVPEFKKGDYNAGVWAGLLQVDKILRDPAYAEELKKPENEQLVGLSYFLSILSGYSSCYCLLHKAQYECLRGFKELEIQALPGSASHLSFLAYHLCGYTSFYYSTLWNYVSGWSRRSLYFVVVFLPHAHPLSSSVSREKSNQTISGHNRLL